MSSAAAAEKGRRSLPRRSVLSLSLRRLRAAVAAGSAFTRFTIIVCGWCSSSPDYSTAIGSVGFEPQTREEDGGGGGMVRPHTWELKISEDATRVWVGVATVDLPLNKRASGIGSSSSARCWHWGSDGRLSSNQDDGDGQPGDVGKAAAFSTNDVLRLTLDCGAGTLSCYNVTTATPAGVLVRIRAKVFPFVCFDQSGEQRRPGRLHARVLTAAQTHMPLFAPPLVLTTA